MLCSSFCSWRGVTRHFYRYLLRIPRRAKLSERNTGSVMSYTLTNGIDVMKAICPKELTKGHCIDKKCKWQHLGTMEMDNKVHALHVVDLIESLIPNEMKGESEKEIVCAKLEIHKSESGNMMMSEVRRRNIIGTCSNQYERIIVKLVIKLFSDLTRNPYPFSKTVAIGPSSGNGDDAVVEERQEEHESRRGQ